MKNLMGTLITAMIIGITGVLFATISDVAVLKNDSLTIHSTLKELKTGQDKIFNYLLEKK